MSLSLHQLYTAGWQELKKVGSLVHNFVAKEQPVVDNVLHEVTNAIAVVSPVLGAQASSFDALEELVVGKVLAISQDVSQAETLSQLMGDVWPVIQSLGATLKSSPAVVAGTASVDKS